MDLLHIRLSGKRGHRRGAENLCFHTGVFHSSAKVALGTLSRPDLIWLTSVSSQGEMQLEYSSTVTVGDLYT